MGRERNGKNIDRTAVNRRVGIPLAVLVIVFLVLQFFSPDQETHDQFQEADMIVMAKPPLEISEILKNSCYDCHSWQSRYPWYSHIVPVSWYLDKHRRKGREELNFSEYGNMSKLEKLGSLNSICEVVDDGTMPLKSYLLVHRDAVLSEEEARMLCEWTETELKRTLEGE